MTDVIIFGTTNFARIIYQYVTASSALDARLNVVAFTVDKAFIKDSDEESIFGCPVLPFEELEKSFSTKDVEIIVAVGYSNLNRLRKDKYKMIKARGYNLASFVHPSTVITGKVERGEHVLILENNTIQPQAKIGNNVIIWSGNLVGHDSLVEDHVFISSGTNIAGHCKIREGSMLGAGCTVAPAVEIGKECIIGAGALMLKDATAGGVYPGQGSIRSKAPSHRIKLH